MKKKYTFSLLFLCLFLFGQAQNLEEIISKHIEAHGGADKWNAVENMKISAKFTAFSEVDDWMAIITKDGKYYSELSLGKFNVVEAFDGQHGWTIDPWMDIDYPRLLNKVEENVFLQKSEWMSPLFNYKEKGITLEYLGEEDLEGVWVYGIKVIRPSGKFEIWYLRKDSYLEYKRVSKWVDFTYEMDAETYFEDFREVEGLIMPFYVEKSFSQRNRILEIEKVELNIVVDEDIFIMPEDPNMAKLNMMKGDWDVKVEAFSPRANRWFSIDETSSCISQKDHNLLEEDITYSISFMTPIHQLLSFHSSSEKYRIARFNGHTSYLNMFTGIMNDTALILDNTQVSYGDSIANSTYTRLIYHFIDQEQFVLWVQSTFDQGKSWMDRQRLSYTRKK